MNQPPPPIPEDELSAEEVRQQHRRLLVRRLLTIGLPVLSVIAIATAVTIPRIKDWRARQFTEEAELLLGQGKLQEAFNNAASAMQMRPGLPDVRRTYAKVLLAAGKAEGMSVLRTMAEDGSANAQDRLNLTDAALQFGDVPLAEREAFQVLQSGERNPEALLRLARVRLAQQRVADALAHHAGQIARLVEGGLQHDAGGQGLIDEQADHARSLAGVGRRRYPPPAARWKLSTSDPATSRQPSTIWPTCKGPGAAVSCRGWGMASVARAAPLGVSPRPGAAANRHPAFMDLVRRQLERDYPADALRGVCRDCGTPLTYEALPRPRIEVSIGSLARHAELRPEHNVGTEAMEHWLTGIVTLPSTRTGEGDNGVGDTVERFDLIRQSNLQHPDHDTEVWPPNRL